MAVNDWLKFATSNLGRTAISKGVAATGKALNLGEHNISETILPKAYADTSKSSSTSYDYSNSYSPVRSSTPTNNTNNSGSNAGSSVQSYSSSDEEDAAGADKDALQKEIENEYENTMGQLGLWESELTSEQPITEQQITNSYQEMLPGIEQSQGQAVGDLNTQEQTGRAETTGVMGQARQTYNELLSGASKFGGSASEGFGELLGRSTAQTLGEARNNLTQLVTKVKGEIGRVNQFYNDKKTNLVQQMNTAIEKTRSEFRAELGKINEAKNVAQRDKSLGNMKLLANFQNQVAQIRRATAVANQELEKWKSSREQTAAEIAKQEWDKFELLATNLNRMGISVQPGGVQQAWDVSQGNADFGSLSGQLYNTKDQGEIGGQAEKTWEQIVAEAEQG